MVKNILKRIIAFSAFFLALSLLHAEEDGQYYERLVIPLCKATVTESGKEEDHEVHTYSGFTLCYRESYEEAEWVAYVLTDKETEAVTGRSEDFRSDPNISTLSASPADYRKSGFDRGHLAPAADMEWSERSTSESFLMSNMTPQSPSFNRGMWKKLEDAVRYFAKEYGKVLVVTGPVLEKPSSDYTFIGEDKVTVPEYFYKVLLSKKEDGSYIAAAFIMPNRKCEGTIYDYEVTVDEVERRTGLDFFSGLDDSIEDFIEGSIDSKDWQ